MGFCADAVELDERIVVFFAGHGYTKTGFRGDVGYLVPYDADMSDFSTFIRWDELTRNSELIRAKHIFFIMDACYGGLALTRNLQPGSVRFLNDMMCRYSRQVLTAGKADEVVADSGGPLPDHSVFTGHLIQGLRGGAASEQGVITANSLMAYVYNKVATDKNSRQTPHYGYFDGDGDFIVAAPNLFSPKGDETKGTDELFAVPSITQVDSTESIQSKVSEVKRFLSDDSSTIRLHDIVVEEVRRFLSKTAEDHFKVQGTFSPEELMERLSKYESIASDLCAFSACIAYWARPLHQPILQKMLSRSADRLDIQSGLTVWLNLRWYPLILEMYCAGIASIEGRRFDSLATVFYTNMGLSKYSGREEQLIESVANAMLELNRVNAPRLISGHERYHAPLSEYLFKLLQPKLDDILFIGKNYENAFDEFEVMFALVVADMKKQQGHHIWGPVGRFGWKHQQGDGSPFVKTVNQAIAEGANWAALKAGLFGGDYERFRAVAKEYGDIISKLNWF